ncbi:DUF4249 domain-containing protein [uncultured Arcticibacterium sp.]|uniref:DUF4249 domain-containing protein n=1 Tax=uncultured Arcticibacterium sp. TaxID=2173042 RepID=UPI0030FCADAE
MSLKILSLLKRAFLAIMLTAISCVEPFDKAFPASETIYIVDGRLTDNTSSNYVKLTLSKPVSTSFPTYVPVSGATVKVIVNGETDVSLTETSSGIYKFPSEFKGEVGSSYQLVFTLANGLLFESNLEKMNPASKINKVYHAFDERAIKLPEETLPGQYVYIDTKDEESTIDFYMWDWVLYEQQTYCQTCDRALYYNDASTGPLGECRPLSRDRDVIYDYRCDALCWEIISASKINVMNDQFSNGREIIGRQVAEIPVYQKVGALIEIRQYAINNNVYDYLRLVESQGQNTGGLADTPPATLAGNINSKDDIKQAIGGYFIVAAVDKQLYWLDKQDIPGTLPAIGLLGGRKVNPEPVNPADTSRPPLAPCINSDTRTVNQPEGWFTARQN